MPPETENTILKEAIGAFHKETGLRLDIVDQAARAQDPIFQYDATLAVKDYEPLQYAAKVKKWAQHANIGALLEMLKRLPLKGLLVADYINPNMAQRLREQDIEFIDTAGNAYINATPLHIYVRGNPKPQTTEQKQQQKNRAFTQTGLKVIYALLCNPELIKAPYRDIAEQADVALGTVGWVMGDLKNMGYIIDRGNKKTRRLENYFKLLDIWVELYPGALKPALLLGEFTKGAEVDNTRVDITQYGGYWGGEVAAAEYTGYLRGEIDIIYIPEPQTNKLIRDLKLFTAWGEETNRGFGKLTLYKPFWQKPDTNDNIQIRGYVHPILAYADLVATGDTRNIETAQQIKDEKIKPLWKN